MTQKKHAPGKWVEKQVADYLEGRNRESIHFAHHRLPDAKSARGALSAQPADFMVCSRNPGQSPRFLFIEAKETANPTRLPKAKIGQHGVLKKWWLAGTVVIVVIYQSAHNHWVYLTADDLFVHEACPPSFKLTDKKTFSTAAELLGEVFQ